MTVQLAKLIIRALVSTSRHASEMKICDPSASFRNRTLCARALVFVLLVGIVHTVTFGSAHSHTNSSAGPGTDRIERVAEQASVSSNIPSHGRSDAGKCLVCLLHQQLSNSIVHSPVLIESPSTRAAFVPVSKVPYSSSFVTSTSASRHAGRAPPLY